MVRAATAPPCSHPTSGPLPVRRITAGTTTVTVPGSTAIAIAWRQRLIYWSGASPRTRGSGRRRRSCPPCASGRQRHRPRARSRSAAFACRRGAGTRCGAGSRARPRGACARAVDCDAARLRRGGLRPRPRRLAGRVLGRRLGLAHRGALERVRERADVGLGRGLEDVGGDALAARRGGRGRAPSPSPRRARRRPRSPRRRCTGAARTRCRPRPGSRRRSSRPARRRSTRPSISSPDGSSTATLACGARRDDASTSNQASS